MFIKESDSSDAISLVNSIEESPWKFHFYFNEIKSLIFSIKAVFRYVSWSINGMADGLAKHGVDRVCALEASLI